MKMILKLMFSPVGLIAIVLIAFVWVMIGPSASQKVATVGAPALDSAQQAFKAKLLAGAQPPMSTPSADLKPESIEDIAGKAKNMSNNSPEKFLIDTTKYPNGTKWNEILWDLRRGIDAKGLANDYSINIEDGNPTSILIKIVKIR